MRHAEGGVGGGVGRERLDERAHRHRRLTLTEAERYVEIDGIQAEEEISHVSPREEDLGGKGVGLEVGEEEAECGLLATAHPRAEGRRQPRVVRDGHVEERRERAGGSADGEGCGESGEGRGCDEE